MNTNPSDSENHRNLKTGLTRRKFVLANTLGLMSIGFLGCSDDDDDNNSGPATPTTPAPNTVSVSRAHFPQSVATGDPRPDSLVFWTRVWDADNPGADYPVRLLIGLDEQLTNVVTVIDLNSMAEYDNAVKVKVAGLTPGTHYYYQFQYASNGSVVGRTKTAPAPNADVPVKFAYMSCQDYVDRYYNAYVLLAAQTDIDFVVHLGDYIYETTEGAVIQAKDRPKRERKTRERGITFSHPEEAIDLGDGEYAANSIGNYRDLYKTYRSDPALQRVHELFPMVAIWDDHEFSNDSWGNTGTYFNGARNETSTQRKHNSERVYAEYMPTSFGVNANGGLTVSDESLFPNTRIYNDFQYGQHLHFLLTDYRTHRPDHVINEAAFPGAVVADEATMTGVFAAQGLDFAAAREGFAAYVNIDEPQWSGHRQALIAVAAQIYLAEGLPQGEVFALAGQVISGNVAVRVLNPMIDGFNAAGPAFPLEHISEEGLPRGLAIFMTGKTDFMAEVGTRSFVVKPGFDLIAGLLHQASGGATEDVYGADQESWLFDTLDHSTATWRVIGSSTSFTSMIWDLSEVPGLPSDFQTAFYLNTDQWDGFPNKRAELLAKYRTSPNTIMIAGDVHHSHVAHHGDGLHEFTVPGVSSTSFKQFARDFSQVPPFSDIPGTSIIVDAMEAMMLAASPVIDGSGERQLKYTRGEIHGFAVVEVHADQLQTTFHQLPESRIHDNLYASPAELAALVQKISFVVRNGQLTSIPKAENNQ